MQVLNVIQIVTMLVTGAVPCISALSMKTIYNIHHRSIGNLNRRMPLAEKSFETPNVQFFMQQKDHSGDDNATFFQRWWYNDEFYEPEGPVILVDTGEIAADNYLGYLTSGEAANIAQATNGLVIILEHRYFGKSQPFADLSTDSLRYHTLENNIQDTVNFMSTVQIPGYSTSLTAPKTPWILLGTSYPGMRSAFLKSKYPNLVFAAESSSAPVQAVMDYWEYFMPVYNALPKNCTADVEAVIAYVDQVLANGTTGDIKSLQRQFHMEDVRRKEDFASFLALPFFLWQSYTWIDAEAQTMKFCDALETIPHKMGVYSDVNGQGLDVALPIYAKFIKTQIPNYCHSSQTIADCFDTYSENSSMYTDISIGNDGRSWLYLVCTAFGFYQIAPPPEVNVPRIIPSLVNHDYYQHQCPLYFPDGDVNKIPSEPQINETNTKWGGWNIGSDECVDNLFWINGQFDPWNTASVNSIYGAPNHGIRPNTPDCPNYIIAGGVHGWDDWGLSARNQEAPPSVQSTVQDVIDRVQAWLPQWQGIHDGSKSKLIARGRSRIFHGY